MKMSAELLFVITLHPRLSLWTEGSQSRYERYGGEQISRLCREAKSDTSVIHTAI